MSRAPLSARRQARYDEFLDAAAADLLDHHARLRDLDLLSGADGGVLHLAGEVDTPAELALARDVLGRLAGVHAVWDRVRVAGREPVIVDVGCGETVQYPGNVGVDRRRTPAVQVVADVGHGLPFASGLLDRVFAVHVLEHLADFLPLVDECHRVLRDDGVLHVLAPWWRHANAVADPTHLRLLDLQTIKGICRRRDSPRQWHPLHASCDGATVFADLTPCRSGAEPGAEPDPVHLSRFFD